MRVCARAFSHSIALLMLATSVAAQEFRKPSTNLTPLPAGSAAGELPDIVVPRYPVLAASTALQRLKSDGLATRGAKEIALFRSHAPSVVLIVTDDGIGSGSLISSDGTVLTNWHVIENHDVVGVIFRPSDPTQEIGESDLVKGTVIRFDEVADLALVKVAAVPAGIRPLKISTSAAIDVGADVSAIGHPTGETWTYTRGLVTQFRPSYKWTTEGLAHQADVIQTQTPINPGNSGGPLLDDDGIIVGVNSFIAEGEGLNFAVAARTLHGFLAAKENRTATRAKPKERECKAKVTAKGHSNEDRAVITQVDTNCDNVPDFFLIVPDDAAEAISLGLDTDHNGDIDFMAYDENRDEKWDSSLTDTDKDGKPDTMGYHDDGKLEPTRVEKYDPQTASSAPQKVKK